jgi:DnaK suppressor protein
MSPETSNRDKAFIGRQRERLTRLLNQLSTTAVADQTEEAGIQNDSSGNAREAEDDAQRLTLLEIDGSLVSRDLDRLARIKRALEKIDDGTYGASDESGETILRDRLEAVPEAIFTVEEEAAHEAANKR